MVSTSVRIRVSIMLMSFRNLSVLLAGTVLGRIKSMFVQIRDRLDQRTFTQEAWYTSFRFPKVALYIEHAFIPRSMFKRVRGVILLLSF